MPVETQPALEYRRQQTRTAKSIQAWSKLLLVGYWVAKIGYMELEDTEEQGMHRAMQTHSMEGGLLAL